MDTLTMRLAINEHPASFSAVWAAFCQEQGIPFRRVNCAASDILAQLQDCDALLWWWGSDARPFALPLTRTLERAGKRVSPASADCWHIDDKVAQKYLLESAGLPAPRTDVFFERDAALAWAATAEYPKVFKLRSSASARNVWLVRSPAQAARFVRRAFGGGFEVARRAQAVAARARRFRARPTPRAFAAVGKHLLRFCALALPRARLDLSERNHACFQDYVPGVTHTYLMFVDDGKAYGVRQGARPGENWVSWTGTFEGGRPEIIPPACVELAFAAARRLGIERLGLEMVLMGEQPLIIETDPFGPMGHELPGFWDDALHWHEAPTVPAREIIARFVAKGSIDAGRS